MIMLIILCICNIYFILTTVTQLTKYTWHIWLQWSTSIFTKILWNNNNQTLKNLLRRKYDFRLLKYFELHGRFFFFNCLLLPFSLIFIKKIPLLNLVMNNSGTLHGMIYSQLPQYLKTGLKTGTLGQDKCLLLKIYIFIVSIFNQIKLFYIY